MQAIVVRDKFDNFNTVQSLYRHLKNFNIVEINSIRELDSAKIFLNPNSPCLLYKNVFMRLDNPQEIWEFHNKNNFNNTIKIGNEIISFIPNTVKIFARDVNTLIYLKPEFQITNKTIFFETPKEKPLCFLYTHNRDTYLKLTLNSLLFATQNIDLKIILNGATPEVKKVALEFANKYSNIEIFETRNCFVSAVNLMLQWYNPKRFILMEDDLIYPPNTKYFFPNFCNQFISRLDYFDLCLWKVTVDNGSSYLAHKRNTFEYLESEWEIWEKNSNQMILAQCVACKTDFYINTLKKYLEKDTMIKKYYACFDSILFAEARNICHPSIRGYHIGWNQEMDGYPKLFDGHRYPVLNEHIFKVKNLNTTEIRKIDLRDLINQ